LTGPFGASVKYSLSARPAVTQMMGAITSAVSSSTVQYAGKIRRILRHRNWTTSVAIPLLAMR